MSVLNYKTGPWAADDAEVHPSPRKRGAARAAHHRAWRRKAKRAEARLAARDMADQSARR